MIDIQLCVRGAVVMSDAVLGSDKRTTPHYHRASVKKGIVSRTPP